MPTSPDDNYYIDKIDDQLARSSANSLVGLGTGLVGKIYHHFKDKQQAAKAAEAYAKKYCDRYGKIRLLGMSQDIDLEDVYTAAKFLDRLSISNRFGSINALEDDYRNAGRRRFQRGKCQSVKGSKVANEHQYLYVLGNPGAGKSTFLRRVGLEALKGELGKYQHDLIPVVIELKQFNKGNFDLVNAIANELAYFNFPDKRKATEDYLEKGKLLLLFDGLDEVSNAYSDEVQNQIDNLKTKYSDNRFILSCRIAAYKSSLTGFTTVELADFDDEQIEKFVHNWFSSELDKQNNVAEECWAKLSQPEYKASLELAQTPLLLTFLCITYDTYQDFPAQRSQLYSEALDILLRKWDAEKRIKRDKIYANWNINLELALLSELAYDFFSRDELFFTKESVLEYIQVFLSDTEGDAKFIDSEAVLDAIAIQQGILVERATGIYSFSHLTLQEYLTAKYISQDNNRIEKLVEEHLTDERWQEVFLLVAGIKDNADDLLFLMEQKIRQLTAIPKLQNLLTWVEKVTNPNNGTFTYLAKRAIVIFFAIIHLNENSPKVEQVLRTNRTFAFVNGLNINILDKCCDINICPYMLLLSNQYKEVEYIANPAMRLIEYVEFSEENQVYRNIEYSKIVRKLKMLRDNFPNTNIITEELYIFTNSLFSFWTNSFDISKESMVLNTEDLYIIDKIFWAYLLMIKTKNAANRTLQKNWLKIESRMLLPA